MPRGWSLLLGLLLLVFLPACGSATRVVRLESSHREPLVFTTHPSAIEPLEVNRSSFQEVMAELGREVRPSRRPLDDARRLFGVPFVEAYALEAGTPEPHRGAPELTRAYLRWCERTLQSGDCLRVLEGGALLDGDGKYALAMAIAHGAVLHETQESLQGLVDPQAVMATVLGACTLYMTLWVLPEPVSKGVASVMTLVLVGYLGMDTVWGILSGWKRLVEEVDRAQSFEEIRAAGERYGEVLGERAARLFVMLATAAVGSSAAQLSAKLPRMPHFSQVAVRLRDLLHIKPSALSQVESVAVSAEGVVIALAPGAVAMAARDTGGGAPGSQGWSPPSGGPGEWVRDTAAMSERSRDFQAQVTGAPPGQAYRVRVGDEEVEFDGFKDGTLLEAKGEGYAQFIGEDLSPKGYYQGFKAMMRQAQRQFEAAQDTPVRWVVAEERLARLLKKLFREARLQIEVVHLPPTP